jgi:hypothetical protein
MANGNFRRHLDPAVVAVMTAHRPRAMACACSPALPHPSTRGKLGAKFFRYRSGASRSAERFPVGCWRLAKQGRREVTVNGDRQVHKL